MVSVILSALLAQPIFSNMQPLMVIPLKAYMLFLVYLFLAFYWAP